MSAKRIRIRRGLEADLPVLLEGELGFCIDTFNFYVGSDEGNKLINGQVEFVEGTKTIVVDSSINGNIRVDGVEIKVFDDTSLTNALSTKANISALHNHANKIQLDRLGVSSGGKLTIDGQEQDNAVVQLEITDSNVNGNIIVDGQEIVVFDSSALTNAISLKADASALEGKADRSELQDKADVTQLDLKADKTELHNHSNKAALDRLGISLGNKITVDGIEQSSGEGGVSGSTVSDSATNGNIIVDGNEVVVFDDSQLEAQITDLQNDLNGLNSDLEGKAEKTELHSHANKASLDRLGVQNGNLTIDGQEVVIPEIPVIPDPTSVTDSTTNGNIVVNGSELVVFDNSQNANAFSTINSTISDLTADVSTKAEAADLANKADIEDLHEHTNKAMLDRLGVSVSGNLTIDGIEIEIPEPVDPVVISDSINNGSIIVDGVEIIVYDDFNLSSQLADKANLTHTHTTADISDFDVTNKTNGHALIYDSAAGKFVSKELPTSGSGSGSGGSAEPVLITNEISQPSLEFDVKNIAVSDLQQTLTLPVTAYNGGVGNAVVHPSVLYFPEKWNGWHYWMGINPYRSTNFENPVILVSQDGINWSEPAGITNPLDSSYDGGYGSDIHLFMSRDNKTMYCLNRNFNGGTYSRLYVHTSTDGITWTPRHTIFNKIEANPDYYDFMSPSVIIKDGQYVMFSVDLYKQVNNSIRNQVDIHTTSNPLGTWTKQSPITIPDIKPDERIWHLEVRHIGDMYYMMYQTSHITTPGIDGRIYFIKSRDLVNWETSDMPISSLFDTFGKVSYKSSFLPMIDGGGLKMRVWYNVTGGASNWDLGYIELYNPNRSIYTSTNSGTLVFYDDFMRESGQNVTNAKIGTWIAGATPNLQTDNGVGRIVTGSNPVYTRINSNNYIVQFFFDELKHATGTEGSSFYVASAPNNDWNGISIGFSNNKLLFRIKKNSNVLTSKAVKKNVRQGDKVQFHVDINNKKITVYVNGILEYEYIDLVDNILVAANNRMGFRTSGTAGYGIRDLRVFALDHKDLTEESTKSLLLIEAGKSRLYKGDHFRKPDGAIGTLVDGTAWTASQGGFEILGQRLRGTAAQCIGTFETGWTDHQVEAMFEDRGGVLLKYVDLNNHIRIEHTNFNEFIVTKRVGGTNTNLLYIENPAGEKVITASMKGTTLTVMQNFRVIFQATVTDSVFTSATKVGVYNTMYGGYLIEYVLASKK